jgi:hypothetical protein
LVLDDLMPTDHVCRVIDSSVEGSAMLGFERAEAAETGRPDYGPRDLLKLYLYGYVNQIRSSRRWECLDSTLTFSCGDLPAPATPGSTSVAVGGLTPP